MRHFVNNTFLLFVGENKIFVLNILKKKKNHFSKFAKNSYFDSIINFTFPISLERYDKIKNHKDFEIYFKEQLFIKFTWNIYFAIKSNLFNQAENL